MSKRQQIAVGTPAAWSRDLCRIAITLPQSTFDLVKLSAMTNNRSLSAEVRTMVEYVLRQDMSINRVQINTSPENANVVGARS